MTNDERAALAESLMSNPLWTVLWQEQEARAVESLVYAPDDEKRRFAAMQVQAIRTFRADCEGCLRNTQPRKNAPA